MISTFTNKIAGGAHKLFKGIDDTGRLAWWLVRLDRLKAPIFDRQRKAGRIVFTDFGEIIKSGYGEAPMELLNG
jgi:hypothetical protein